MNVDKIRDFRRNLRRIERETERQLRDQTDCCGITLAQCHVLLELDTEGRLNLTELAERLRLDASTLSRTVEGMVQAGIVDRSVNPQNRRAIQLSLTLEGRERASTIHRECDAFYRGLLERMTPDRREGFLEGFLEGIRLLAELVEGIPEKVRAGCGAVPMDDCRSKEQGGSS